jgi:hypothetical protein
VNADTLLRRWLPGLVAIAILIVSLRFRKRLVPMEAFEHESLDPYPATLEFVTLLDRVSTIVPPARNYLVTELQQAAWVMAESIAVGASEPNHAEQLRFMIDARRAALRCAVLLDSMNAVKVIPLEYRDAGRLILLRIVDRVSHMEHALSSELTGPHEKEKGS